MEIRDDHTRKARLSRYKRANNPPPFDLTERDKEVIRWVHRCRYLTSKQVLRLPSFDGSKAYLFPQTTKSNVDKRLRLLFHHGYLWRMALPVERGSGPAIYCLDTRGRDLIAHELQVEALAGLGKGLNVSRSYPGRQRFLA